MHCKFDVYSSWSQYIVDVAQRFGEVYDDPLNVLIQVKHTGKIQEYVDDFELALGSPSS